MLNPIFHNIWIPTATILVACLLALWFAPQKEGRRVWRIAAIRCFAILLFALALFRPAFLEVETEYFSGTVLILLDVSQSMSVRDVEVGGARQLENESRFESARRALEASAPQLDALTKKVRARVWTFDDTTFPTTLEDGSVALPDEPTGRASAIGAALEDSLNEAAGEKILGVVLFSDGAQRATGARTTLPQNAAARLKRMGVPLYPVCFGSSAEDNRVKEAVVEDFQTPQRVFVDTELPVSGSVRLEGLEGAEVPLVLEVEYADGVRERVGETTLRPSRASETFPILLTWLPKRKGEVKMTLRLPPVEGETSLENNELSAFVNIVEGNLPVLYLEGAHRPETGFLRRALLSAREIQLDVFHISAWDAEGRPSMRELLRKPYALVILGDVDASSFSVADWTLLREKIANGTGLLTLGGVQNYGSGGFFGSPMAEVFPIEMDRLERRRPEDPVSPSAQWDRPLKMTPTPAGRRHFALALDANSQTSASLWDTLPLLDGANRFVGIKPGATTLAHCATDEGEIPLLLETIYGRGRVMTLPIDSTWRWVLAGHESAHARFWTQLVFWLAQKENSMEGMVDILMPQRRFSQQQPISFQITAKLSTGENLVERIALSTNPNWEDWDAFLELPDGTREQIALQPESEALRGTISRALPPGDYSIHASVSHAGEKIGDAQCRFSVFHYDLEMDSVKADPQMMAALAEISGGEVVSGAALGGLWEKLAEKQNDLKIEREMIISVWDRWYWMLLLICVLSLEWYLRRRIGLV
ncbi:MAG: hypothetical protein Q4D38_00760 [Planctomycetia bacterium]|nr:hypothetical protein [Planctomycetia bacterium]